MKIQCACGAKYSFDVTPEMAENPVELVCTGCGTDLSDIVNNLIRQDLQPAEPAAPEPEPAPPAGEPTAGLRIRVHVASKGGQPATVPADEMPVCLKHPPNRTTHKCLVCQKPICPECMALFGYVCSPHCKAKATANGIELPVYKGERAYVEAQRWRKAGWVAAAIAAVVAALIGGWIWFEFVGSLPRSYFSVRFAERAHTGEAVFSGGDQMVFLHGVTLSRCDLKQKKQIWSRDLLSKDEAVLADLRLKVAGQNIWVVAPEKMTRYDWNSGEPKQEIPLTDGIAVAQGDEVLLVSGGPAEHSVEHINLANGDTRTEAIHVTTAAGKPRGFNLATTRTLREPPAAGLPVRTPGKNPSAPLNPAEVAAQFQSLSTPARIALPAVLASTAEQERLLAEMTDHQGNRSAANNPAPLETFALIPRKDGCLQFSLRLLERRIIARSAMKDRPAKSVLDSGLKSSDTDAAVNELLNDIQREHGADQVTEDHSRYLVTLRNADTNTATGWTGEVVGPPGLIPLETVNVLVAGNVIRVFDKSNKKLWEATLTFNLPLERFAFADESYTGKGPCVERNGSLYVADEGVLTAFNLADGNVRWRLPTVGIVGMFFDDRGMVYVNTTTANPEMLRYSRQIDVTHKIDPVVLKIDPRSGKTLWSTKPGGFVNYIAGKYVYVATMYAGDFDENGNPYGIETGLEKSAYLRIRRLNPENGSELWSHFQQRCPLDMKFDRNIILLTFRKEVQALKFLTF